MTVDPRLQELAQRTPNFGFLLAHEAVLVGYGAAAKRLDIANGAIVNLIGAVDSFTISTMPTHDATKDVITDYSLPAEMTGTGEITNGTVHIRAVMAVEGDQAVAGHLHRAEIGTFFARAYVIPC